MTGRPLLRHATRDGICHILYRNEAQKKPKKGKEDMQVVQSEIQAVSVYSSGSVVTRVAELGPGGAVWPLQVRIAGLPLALDDASVKVRVEGGGDGTRPSAVSFRVALEVLDGAPTAEPADEEALRVARREMLVLEGRLESLRRLISRLTQLPLPARPIPRKGEAPPASPHAGRTALIDFQQKKLKTLNSAAEDVAQKLRAAREALAGAEDRRRCASAAREPRQNELRKTVVVSLSPPQRDGGGAARLLLEYHVPGARWAPAYSLHFNKDFSHATLSARAVVAQQTGEDWKNVRVMLSTAQMQAWTELPELASIRLGRWQSPPSSGWRPLPPGANELYADYDREAAALSTGAVERKKPEDTGEFAIAVAALTPAQPPETPPAVAGGSVVRPVPTGARGRGALLISGGQAPAERSARVSQSPAAPVAPPPPEAEFTSILAPSPPMAFPPPSAAPLIPALSIREPAARPVSASLDYRRCTCPDQANRGKGNSAAWNWRPASRSSRSCE